ncbi:MAG TPA: hypothetical protein VE173_07030, partial [Longimicrobiales bacterium]|nr:hypothetical protein [Longimicrobiales bacterium]
YKIARRPEQGGEDAEPEIVTVTDGRLMKRPVPVKTRPRPYAYILPPEAREAVAMLRRHHIAVEVLDRPTTLAVDAYTLADIGYERAYDHDAATRVTVGEVVTLERDFPAGSFVVSTAQMMGRLVAHMLEPESTDNVIYWNTMDAWLPKARLAEEGEETPSGGRGGAGGGGRGGFGRGQQRQGPPLIPIFKLMEATPLPTRLMEG